MKYTECPRCKSKFGKVLRRVLLENDKVMLWVDGLVYTVDDNAGFYDTPIKDYKLLCRNCSNYICTYGEMFKEELKCTKLK